MPETLISAQAARPAAALPVTPRLWSRTAAATALRWVAELAARASSLLTFPLLAGHLGAHGYGAYSQVNTLVGLAIPFAGLGLTGVLVRFFAAEDWTRALRRRLGRVFLLVTLSAGGVGLVMGVSGSWLNAMFLRAPEGTALFQWGGALIVAGAWQLLLFDFLRARQRFLTLAALQLAEVLLTVAVVVSVLPAGGSLPQLLQALLAVKLWSAGCIAASLWLWDRPRAAGRGLPPLALAEMIRFGLPLAALGMGLWMMQLGDRLVIGHWLGAEALGRYAAAYGFTFLLAAVVAPLNVLLYPRLMQALASGDAARVGAQVRLFHRYVVLLLLPAAGWLLLGVAPLLQLMGGPAFHVPQGVIVMLLAAAAIPQWNTVAHYGLLCVGAKEVLFSQAAWLAAGALNILANCYAVPRWGLWGAAGVTLLTFAALDAAIFWRAQRVLPLRRLYRWDVTGRAAAAAGVAALASHGLLGPSVGQLAASAGLFTLVYAVGLRLAGEWRRA